MSYSHLVSGRDIAFNFLWILISVSAIMLDPHGGNRGIIASRITI